MGRAGIVCAVDVADVDAPRIRTSQSDKHIDGRGLACAVGAKKTKQLPPIDIECDATDRMDIFKAFGDIFN